MFWIWPQNASSGGEWLEPDGSLVVVCRLHLRSPTRKPPRTSRPPDMLRARGVLPAALRRAREARNRESLVRADGTRIHGPGQGTGDPATGGQERPGIGLDRDRVRVTGRTRRIRSLEKAPHFRKEPEPREDPRADPDRAGSRRVRRRVVSRGLGQRRSGRLPEVTRVRRQRGHRSGDREPAADAGNALLRRSGSRGSDQAGTHVERLRPRGRRPRRLFPPGPERAGDGRGLQDRHAKGLFRRSNPESKPRLHEAPPRPAAASSSPLPPSAV